MKVKILTVDDSKTIRVIVARAFESYDCDVYEAANGLEGLSVAAAEKPNLIILDLTMPVMDGAEMLAKLKASPELKSIPVIMLTAEAGRENVVKIAKLGVRDYLIKPFKEDALIDRVGRVVELKLRGGDPQPKHVDDPLNILIVDDKPAIIEQIRQGLADKPWKIHSKPTSAQAMEFCAATPPDAMLVSLSLAENAGFLLFQMFHASPRFKSIPVFALSVKAAAEEQARAQQCGFTGIITKPIDVEALKGKIAKALQLETSYQFYETRDAALIVRVPAEYDAQIGEQIVQGLRAKVADAVDGGVDRMVLDLTQVITADVSLVKLGMTAAHVAEEFSIKIRMAGSDAVALECKNYEETKHWIFEITVDEALAVLSGGPLASATA